VTSDTVRRIDHALRSLAPSWVRTGARAVDISDLDGLWPSERAAVRGAVIGRQTEFATGRALLRQLIGQNVEIGVGATRRPLLPPGIVGTLAHDHQIALAAVTRRSSCSALGVDLEPAVGLSPEDAQVVLRPEERDLDAHLVFVLKEAVYKAWSALGGPLIEHHDVTVSIDGSGRDFTASIGPNACRFAGRYIAVEGRYVALVVVDDT
jgi:4'-phosphopantetheinyl transferase EntD